MNYAGTSGQEQTALGTSITIGGLTLEVPTPQKELAEKVAKEVRISTTDAFKIVVQQGKLGVTDLSGLVQAYMSERIALLRVIKFLLRTELHGCENKKTQSLVREVVAKVKEDKEFVGRVIGEIKKQTSESLPSNATTEAESAFVWSRQILLEQHQLLEILFLVTSTGTVSSQVVTSWFDLLKDTLLFSNQRNVSPHRTPFRTRL